MLKSRFQHERIEIETERDLRTEFEPLLTLISKQHQEATRQLADQNSKTESMNNEFQYMKFTSQLLQIQRNCVDDQTSIFFKTVASFPSVKSTQDLLEQQMQMLQSNYEQLNLRSEDLLRDNTKLLAERDKANEMH
jgi:hypothetical protein